MIRVPDASAGKKGTCPRCSEKLIVPDIPAPAHSSSPEPEEVPAFTPRISVSGERNVSSLPELGSGSSMGGLPALGGNSAPASRSLPDSPKLSLPGLTPQPGGSLPGLPGLDSKPGAPVIGLAPLAEPSSLGAELSRKRRMKKSSASSWMIPMACVVVLLAVIGFLVWNSQPKLEGQLVAHSVKNLEVRPGLISGDLSGMSKEDLGGVLRRLRAQPAHWSSSASRTTLAGTDDGVEVTVKNGSATHFVAVNPGQNKAFLDFITKNSERLDAARRATIAKHAPKLFAAWKLQFDKDARFEDQKTHRDQVAWPSLVTGIGYHMEAVVRDTAYSCVYEDGDGQLYFLLPNATRSFVVQGKRVPGGSSITAKFQVKIEGSQEAPATRSKSRGPKSQAEREAENLGMNPDLYKDKSSGDSEMNSEGEAISNGLDDLLVGGKKPVTKSAKKKSTMMSDDDDSMMDQMSGEKTNKSMLLNGKKAKPQGEMMEGEMMDEGMMDEGEMMDQMPAKKPAASKKSASKSN